jgi:hypothetical protein
MKPVDKLGLERWRELDAAKVLSGPSDGNVPVRCNSIVVRTGPLRASSCR